MPTRTVFSDDNNNEMDVSLNDKGEVYISVGPSGGDDPYRCFITLAKTETEELLKVLTKLYSEMAD